MKHYYLADLIGTGEADVDDFRASVANHPVGWGWSCPSDSNGMPLNKWGLVEVFTASPEALEAMAQDPSIDPLPFLAHDAPLTGVDTTSLRAALVRRDIGEDVLDSAETFGALLDNIAARAESPL
jgi:hypothetical protein